MTTPRTRKKIDPFAPEVNEETSVTETKETETLTDPAIETDPQTGELVLTFKAGSGYDAPWMVAHLPDLVAADHFLSDDPELLKSVMGKAARAGVYFASQMPAKAASSGSEGGNTGGGGAGRQAAPGGQSRSCKHGDMVFRSGSSNGRAWEAFFCPTPKGTAGQCKAEFL